MTRTEEEFWSDHESMGIGLRDDGYPPSEPDLAFLNGAGAEMVRAMAASLAEETDRMIWDALALPSTSPTPERNSDGEA